MQPHKRKRLGDFLVEAGTISQEQLLDALGEQKKQSFVWVINWQKWGWLMNSNCLMSWSIS
jgi:hypothetical protein